MGGFSHLPTLLALSLVLLIPLIKAELTPPYFNLAEGRKIAASATCGVDTDGPELYCKLVGANTENDQHYYSLIQGQVCDYCNYPDKIHPAEYAIDGTENWWQSPPLSRGMKYNEVNLTIDFGQEFHVAYLFIRMGNSPRPGLWTLEKSSDYGKTWSAWQHFSDSPTDCEIYFGADSLKPITKDDDVICTTEFSKIVPLEGGEIPVMLLNNRPSANNYFNSSVLQEWTRATNVRIRLLRTKNLLGHLMSVARQDPTVTRRYFYSIKDISVGGRCVCNGHANTCNVLDPRAAARLLSCQCQHNTCGIQCQECCPGFEQKKWHQNTNARPFQCEPCNCFGHSNKCVYSEEVDLLGHSLDIHGNYEGGGVCQECQDHTEGINCNKCNPEYYRPSDKHWNETDVCQPCNCNYFYSTGNCEEETGRCECRVEFQAPNCDSCSEGYFGYPNCRPCECFLNGTEGNHCESIDGKCPCKSNFGGDFCKSCAEGFYNFPTCEPCECNGIGSTADSCHEQTGQCECQINFAGKQCDRCKDGYFDYPTCTYCSCDNQGTEDEVCDKQTGQCLCREGFGGPRCDQCLPRFYNYPDCMPCNCSAAGSVQDVCDTTGKCPCLSNFAGKQCTSCSAGYYQYPECLACNCDSHGSRGLSCNNEGQCQCEYNFDGKTCNQCKESFYNFPACEDCNCDPAGVIAKFAGCGSVPAGELCQCKERVQGRICDQCRPLYWNLNATNIHGCEECDCYNDGTIGGLDTCNIKTGQCNCKSFVQGRKCSECADGTFLLEATSLFGCDDCDCDIGGSATGICNKIGGQCKCHPRIAGRTCTYPLTTHYFPTLYQFQFEYEDGYTSTGAQVRYQFDEDVFPGFSKIGYAVFSPMQSEVYNEVNIVKSSVYRLIIRYINPTSEPVVAEILITSDNPLESDQTAKVLFKPNRQPEFVTMSGSKGEIPSALVLDPGRYTIKVKTDKNLFLDYFVLLPAAYYEASVLTRKVNNPCEYGDNKLCRHYKYPSIKEYNPIYEAYITENGERESHKASQFYTDYEHLTFLNEDHLVSLNDMQPKLNYAMDVPKYGRYIIVVDYITDRLFPDIAYLSVNQADDVDLDGIVTAYSCTYSTVCRQPVLDKESREKVFFIDVNDMKPIEVSAEQAHIAIKSITAIPYDDWSIDFISARPVCVREEGKCVQSHFQAAPDSKKLEFENDTDDARKPAENMPDIYDNSTKVVLLDHNMITLTSKVPDPGHYVIVVKYYQPNHPQFHIVYRLETDKQNYDGKLKLDHCPSSSGCRVLLKQDNGIMRYDIEETVSFTLNNIKDKGVWLDYVLLVPANQFNENLLHEEEFDQTKEFIKQCGHDHFNIPLNATEFCKSAVFSLTADYNSGALPCNCDYYGSLAFECEAFGGQCQCKPNIIGRNCEACRTGFYGFPDCKPCDCPSTAICEKETGECICPPRVTGEKCDQCVPHTFGFDQIIGCEECGCNSRGVDRGDLQCDLNNGSCVCRPNVVGRSCDKCQYGFFNFPHCDACRCDLRGTTFEVCDQDDESCFCKSNVEPRGECSTCMEGTFNLQESNPEGCTKCFCFGKTTRCESAYLRPYNVSMLKDVSLNTFNFTGNTFTRTKWVVSDNSVLLNETTAQVDLIEVDNPQLKAGLVYFGMLDFLANQNNHLSSYGEYLRYTIYYTTGFYGNALIGPDVVLEGKNMTIVHTGYQQPASAQIFRGSVKFLETNFQTISGASVTREQFMSVLRDLEGIYIRASYFEQGVLTTLSDVFLTLSDDDPENYNLYTESSVEKCDCPRGYSGLSCQDCSPGFYRDPDGPFGGYCIPCNCHGHADTCDCNTGVCQDCQHATTGDHCDMCIEGYYGNAINGHPDDCMICACPLPIESNNFAVGCDVSSDGYKISCDCRPGYTGHKCQSCAAGFFGQPEIEGESCRPCDCSGNINPSQHGSCDSVSGECLLCLNNTSGAACNLCAPGYYGDAIRLKDCQSCICDDLGTEYCDNFVGTCNCQQNVIGEKCDRCEDDHYGFDSGYGCNSCDCGIASNSTQCDDHTGVCACKYGVTGRQCDRCLPGYWNYGPEGCIPCSCNTDYSVGLGCNAETGQCECLNAVVGEKCDACPYRWVFVPEYGCNECGHCHHDLLDVTDALKIKIDPVIEDFSTVAKTFYTTQKLKKLNEDHAFLHPLVEDLDPNKVNLGAQSLAIDSLESDIKAFQKSVSYTVPNSKDRSKDTVSLLKNATDSLDNNRLVSQNVRNTIRDVHKLANSLDLHEKGTKFDMALSEAQDLLNKIKGYEGEVTNSDEQLDKTISIAKDVEAFSGPVNDQKEALKTIQNNIGSFDEKLEDLYKWSTISARQSAEAEALLKNLRNKRVNQKFETVTNHTKEADKSIEDGNELRKKASKIILDTYQSYKTLDGINAELKDINEQVDKKLPADEDDLKELEGLIQNVNIHASTLVEKAEDLITQYSNISANSEEALKAATAYKDIESCVTSAQESVDSAKYSGDNATVLTNGVGNRAGQSDQLSSDLLNSAREALITVQSDLKPHVEKSAMSVKKIEELNVRSGDQLNAINSSLDQIKVDSPTDTWQNAKDEAVQAHQQAKEALDILKPITANLESATALSKGISKDIDDTNKNIVHSGTQVERVQNLVPEIIALADVLQEKQSKIDSFVSDFDSRVDRLRRQIEAARVLANSIKVGTSFQPNTTLELKPPVDLQQLATTTKFSAYFKTEKPNGFLLYLGKEEPTTGQRAKQNDFMALEIENGYPVLSVDLGNGPERIISNKYVSNDEWHQVIVDRTGNNVKLIIREEIEGGADQVTEKEEILPGPYSVFDVDQDSRLFVGGYSDFNIPDSVRYSAFEGQIEELKVGDQDVGLWNFVDGQNNNLGARERDRLITQEIPNTGLRFGGNGYVILDAKPFNFRQRSHINFNFKAGRDSPDGLLFYAGQNHHFISVELKGGAIVFQFKLGQYSDVVKIGTANSFNDDQWHTVEASREHGEGILTVDDNTLYHETDFDKPKTMEELKISDLMYFGGHPLQLEHDEVANKHFDGCIDEVHISGTKVDLSMNLQAYDVRPGCPVKFSALVSYPPGNPGYLKLSNVTSSNHLQINLKFKSKQASGLILYTLNYDQTATFSLALDEGILVLRSTKEELNTGKNKYNNGEWHVVTATHDGKRLRLSVDDTDHYKSEVAPPPLHLEYGEIFFGGLPKDFVAIRGAVSSDAYFAGCISDVTISGQVVNFASASDKDNVLLNNCARDLFDYDVTSTPIFYPNGDTAMPRIDTRLGVDVSEGQPSPKVTKPPRVQTTTVVPEEEERELPKTKPQTTTTTKKPVTRPPPKPEGPQPTCRLPVSPEFDVDFETGGYRFGTSVNSRVELQIPQSPKPNKKSYEFKLQFRTDRADGILFYADDVRHTDYVAIYMRNGYVHHVFKAGAASVNLTSENLYNDGEWHSITITRHQNRGEMIIDNDDRTGDESAGAVRPMILQSPYYIGGISNENLEDIALNLKIEKTFLEQNIFFGCIKKIESSNRALEDRANIIGTLPCSDEVEPGVFFGRGGGYVKLRERFNVGTDLTVQMDIKPRTETGLLLSVHGKKSYLILQLINGTINFTVENGDGPITAIFKPDNDENFCDGQWRTITAIKSQYVITIMVNKMSSEPMIGNAGSTVTLTTRPLFLGGHPHLQKIRGLTARTPYQGCIRNVSIRDIREDISPKMTIGNVEVGVCPLN